MTESPASDLIALIREDPLNERNFPALEEQVRKPVGVVPFIGAGLSMPLGFSGWTEFLRAEGRRNSLEGRIEDFIRIGDYEEAAELLQETMGFTEFEDALNAEFGDTRLGRAFPNPDAAVMCIPRLTNGAVFTTNFDCVLERAFELSSRPFSYKIWAGHSDLHTRALNHDGHVLVKIHGDILDRQGRVLTLGEYREHYGSDEEIDFELPLPNLLRRLFDRDPVLFLGCSLNNDRTLRVLKKIGGAANPHYAIVERPASESQLSERRKYLSNHWIRAIWFPTGRFESVGALLNHLAGERLDALNGPGMRSNETGDRLRTGAAKPKAGSDAGQYWDGKAWDHSVHERLGETLVFYLVRVRPYNEAEVVRAFVRIVEELGLGSVRVYGILGNMDLLIRAWLPASLATRFAEKLPKELHNCKGVYPFTVDRVEHRWYEKPLKEHDRATRGSLLNVLDWEMIERVQRGEDAAGDELERLQLVFENGAVQPPRILFFVSINFQDSLRTDVMRAVSDGIRGFLVRSEHKYPRATLDIGHGFCQLLVKAETEEFFLIREITSWISEQFGGHEVITETWLCQHPRHLAGGSQIGSVTFDVLAGHDLFVLAVIPEVYPRRSDRHSAVERFLKDNYEAKKTGAGGRRFLRECLLPILRNTPGEFVTTLFRLFFEWEGYLRGNHREFLGKIGLNPTNVYKDAKVSVDKKAEDLTLVDVLQIYSWAVRGTNDAAEIGTHWTELTNLRNATVHNRIVSVDDEWKNVLSVVLSHWQRIRFLICVVERVTGKPFTGTYLDPCGFAL